MPGNQDKTQSPEKTAVSPYEAIQRKYTLAMELAIDKNHPSIVMQLIKGGIDVKRQGRQGLSFFTQATQKKRTEIEAILSIAEALSTQEDHPSNERQLTKKMIWGMEIAIRDNLPKYVKGLLNIGIDPSGHCENGTSFLALSQKNERKEIETLLINAQKSKASLTFTGKKRAAEANDELTHPPALR